MKQFIVPLSDQHIELINNFCLNTKMSKAEFIRRLLDKYFKLDPLGNEK